MFVARTKEHQLVSSEKYERGSAELFCPSCGAPVVFRCGEVNPRIAGTILNEMGLKVASGERKYSDGDIVDNVANVPIRLKEMLDANGKPVLRLIFPDANGLFPEDINCNPTFLLQMYPISMLYASSELPY